MMIEKYLKSNWLLILFFSVKDLFLTVLGKLKCYDSIDNCPVWNYWKISVTGDIRYILKNSSEHSKPASYISNKIKESYQKLLDSDKKADFRLLKSYLRCYKSYLNYLIDEKNETKYNLLFMDYMYILDVYYKEYSINNIKFNTALDAYKYVNSVMPYKQVLEYRLKIFDPERLDNTRQTAWDIYNDCLLLGEMFNQRFNPMRMTVSEYYSAIELMRRRKTAYHNFRHGSK